MRTGDKVFSRDRSHQSAIKLQLFTTVAEIDGAGLGLVWCGEIAEAWGKYMGANSEWGDGTALFVELPISSVLMETAV